MSPSAGRPKPIADQRKAVPPQRGSPDPLHGITLEAILTQLVYHYGWQALGERIKIRCFNFDPSIPSSLQFLRRTPWARSKVEALYQQHVTQHPKSRPHPRANCQQPE